MFLLLSLGFIALGTVVFLFLSLQLMFFVIVCDSKVPPQSKDLLVLKISQFKGNF